FLALTPDEQDGLRLLYNKRTEVLEPTTDPAGSQNEPFAATFVLANDQVRQGQTLQDQAQEAIKASQFPKALRRLRMATVKLRGAEQTLESIIDLSPSDQEATANLAFERAGVLEEEITQLE